MQLYTKLALISAVVFLVVGYSNTYSATEGILGPIVGQSGDQYGVGNTINDYGFLIHALVMFLVMFFILKQQMRG